MSLGLGLDLSMQVEEGTSQGGGASKRQAVGASGKEQSKFLTAVARLALTTSIQNRMLQGALYRTLLLPVECPHVALVNKAGVLYHENVKADKTKRASLGPVHLHQFDAFVTAHQADTKNLPLRDEIAHYFANAKAAGLAVLCSEVRVFKLSKCHNKALKKINIFTWLNTDADKILTKVLTDFSSMYPNADLRVGPPPPSEAERILQAMLDGK